MNFIIAHSDFGDLPTWIVWIIAGIVGLLGLWERIKGIFKR